jgi:hypothetical protein
VSAAPVQAHIAQIKTHVRGISRRDIRILRTPAVIYYPDKRHVCFTFGRESR